MYSGKCQPINGLVNLLLSRLVSQSVNWWLSQWLRQWVSQCSWVWTSFLCSSCAGCSALEDDDGGYWSPDSCSSGANDQGATCSLVCYDGYELKGSAFIQCTENGWNSSNGNFIPKCLREYGLCFCSPGLLGWPGFVLSYKWE